MREESTALAVAQTAAIGHRFQPQELREMVKVEAELRGIMVDYYKSAMKEGHHYYSIKDGSKPALSKEGGLNLCSLFKVIVGEPQLEKIWHPDGHLTVEARVPLLTPAGDVVAVGAAMCSTHESKYAYRWCFDNQVPDHLDKDSLPSMSGVGRNGRKYTKYRVPNDDLADCYNTAIKMADKRAMVAAACKLPLVSELFTQDLDETIRAAVDERDGQDRQARGKRQDSGNDNDNDNAKQTQRGASEAQLGALRKLAKSSKLTEEQAANIARLIESDPTSRQASAMISKATAAIRAAKSETEPPPPAEPEDGPPPPPPADEYGEKW